MNVQGTGSTDLDSEDELTETEAQKVSDEYLMFEDVPELEIAVEWDVRSESAIPPEQDSFIAQFRKKQSSQARERFDEGSSLKFCRLIKCRERKGEDFRMAIPREFC